MGGGVGKTTVGVNVWECSGENHGLEIRIHRFKSWFCHSGLVLQL